MLSIYGECSRSDCAWTLSCCPNCSPYQQRSTFLCPARKCSSERHWCVLRQSLPCLCTWKCPRPASSLSTTNLSTASFSQNHLANELAVSSTYSLLNAIYMHLHEVGSEIYGAMEWPEVRRRVQRYAEPEALWSTNRLLPSASVVPAARTSITPAARRPNLVILVVESLGAGFVGKLRWREAQERSDQDDYTQQADSFPG